MDRDSVIALLSDADKILIVTHVRPDGDTAGSAAGLCRGLRSAGKSVCVKSNRELSPRLRRMLGIEELYPKKGFKPEFIVAVDVAHTDMMPENCRELAVDLVIDHHASNPGYAKYNYIVGGAASCGEVVYDLMKGMGIVPDKPAASALYIAISTDTGCFRYSNTTSGTHRAAAELMDLGADAENINYQLFMLRSTRRVAIERLVMDGTEFTADGQLAVSMITQKIIKETGAKEDDIDDMASLLRCIEGVIIGVTIKELPVTGCKLSVRTAEPADASLICSKMGGGGHCRAGGCNFAGSAVDAKKAITSVIAELYPGLFADNTRL